MAKRKASEGDGEQGNFYALEIEVTEEESVFLMRHPRKASVYLSKKMQEKGKEHSWQELSLDRKQDFDMAQAKELSNVLQSKALRSLTNTEWKHLDKKRVMQMRWVLTTKPTPEGSIAKARLVVLGFQQPNLTQVQAAAPTMSRVSRNMLLCLAANYGYKLRSGDVTSAFLQAKKSLENEDLVVWAPPELAVLYGADPANPVLPLKVVKAFYGLVHAPRAWYDEVAGTLAKQGWTKLVSDGCIFILKDGPQVVGMIGVHVDDFLLAGCDGNAVFDEAKTKLEQSYRWGRWEEKQFTFAGCQITQNDKEIHIGQSDYAENWVDEIEVDKERAKNRKAVAASLEISQLRGVIGSLSWQASQTAPQMSACCCQKCPMPRWTPCFVRTNWFEKCAWCHRPWCSLTGMCLGMI